MVAASSSNYPSLLKVAVILILFLTYLPSKPVGSTFSSFDTKNMKEREQLVGSRPPGCVNKCLSCKPCMATLVILPHQWGRSRSTSNHQEESDESYYLLSWKCKCGNKLFHP